MVVRKSNKIVVKIFLWHLWTALCLLPVTGCKMNALYIIAFIVYIRIPTSLENDAECEVGDDYCAINKVCLKLITLLRITNYVACSLFSQLICCDMVTGTPEYMVHLGAVWTSILLNLISGDGIAERIYTVLLLTINELDI